MKNNHLLLTAIILTLLTLFGLNRARTGLNDPCAVPPAEYWLYTAPERITPWAIVYQPTQPITDRTGRAFVIAPLLASGELQLTDQLKQLPDDPRLPPALSPDPATLFNLRALNVFAFLIIAAAALALTQYALRGQRSQIRTFGTLISLIAIAISALVNHAGGVFSPYLIAYALISIGICALIIVRRPSVIAGTLAACAWVGLLFYAPPFWIIALIGIAFSAVRYRLHIFVASIAFIVTLFPVFGGMSGVYPILWLASANYPLIADNTPIITPTTDDQRTLVQTLQTRIPNRALVEFPSDSFSLTEYARCPMGANVQFRAQPAPAANFAFTDDRLPYSALDYAITDKQSNARVLRSWGGQFIAEHGRYTVQRLTAFDRPTDINFGDQFYLLGTTVPTAVQRGDLAEIVLTLQYGAAVNVDTLGYGLFIHITKPDQPGEKIAEYSGAFIPRANRFGVREIVPSLSTPLLIPASTTPGTYDVLIGFYKFADNARLSPYMIGTQPGYVALSDALRIGQITVSE